VDHGKTTLLDAIRQTQVARDEEGGITQHIGAYQVTVASNGGKHTVTFLDTPGHEAFTVLRSRGAQVTDLVVLVVAADDGVMPQTLEALHLARNAEVPIVVAINKIDKPGANSNRVRQELATHGLISEEWGGHTLMVEVSARTGDGIEMLLESVVLQAEMSEPPLEANPNRAVRGSVLESRQDTGLGAVATVLIHEGTLRVGDIMVVGERYGRVRAMFEPCGAQRTEASPSAVVEVAGLFGVPVPGQVCFQVDDEKTARNIAEQLQRKHRTAGRTQPLRADPLLLASHKELKVIVKADVQGSVEAVCGALTRLGHEEVKVRVIHNAVGHVTENDIGLAASGEGEAALIVGFNVHAQTRVQALAQERGVALLLRPVIYAIEEEVTDALEALLEPIVTEKSLGWAEVRNTFVIPRVGTIAGAYVTSGHIVRGSRCRVIRAGQLLHTSRIVGLQRFKDQARRVGRGYECGLRVAGFDDVEVGDTVECFEVSQVPATLTGPR
ncbi:MAG: translation initiation factor IF-2, partial [Myxococcota bacterium]